MAVRCLSLLKNTSKSWCRCRQQMSSFTRNREAAERRGMLTWKRITMFLAVPVSGYLGWTHLIADEEVVDEAQAKAEVTYEQSTIERLWIKYLFEDPVERDRKHWDHLAKMQKRKEAYLRKKKAAIDTEVPLQPMDLFTEIVYTPVNPRDDGMEN